MSPQGARLQTILDTYSDTYCGSAYPVIVLSCPACRVFQRIPGPFAATKTRGAGFVDENRKKEMRGKSWWVPDLIAETKFKMADS